VKANRELLAKLEKLSHLYIAEDKKDEILSQLSDVLAYVDNLSELDTSNLDSYFSTIEGGTPIREDIPQKSEEISKSILEHAPAVEDDFFIVPAIIE
jgi:aspartyl-tRNA(Asn)/glutamyl-tRNA(Gln) amidotransferase subunit C